MTARRRWRYTSTANADLELILDETYRQFGSAQVLRCAQLIDRTAELATLDPSRPASRNHGAGIRSLHVAIAAGRRSSASHIMFYRVDVAKTDGLVSILRVLHERMDPVRHLGEGE